MSETKGRVTIPTDLDVIPETLKMLDEWGADAIRDCDGTEFPAELKKTGAKIYATYYTTRKDNAWAKAHPEEIQQMYIMTSFHTAVSDTLEIHLMDHLYPDMLAVNTRDDIRRWWEVIDRTTGEAVSTEEWSYDEKNGNVVIRPAKEFHEYTVSFLAYIMWDPVHMYNAVVNDWKDVEPQITFDVRQPATRAHSMDRLRRFLDSHDYVNVVRFTTFFHQFTLIFDEMAREKYVDWFGYSASVSPYILEQFEKFQPHLVLLDISLPFFDGYYWCRQIRRASQTPIIFLSSAGDDMNLVMAIQLGADDFIPKPFRIEVVLAKIQALLRRTYSFGARQSLVRYADVSLNPCNGKVWREDAFIELTRNESRILQILMEARGGAVTRESIIKSLWEDESFIDDNTLTVNVARLRKKLEQLGLPSFIKTRKGVGYFVRAEL